MTALELVQLASNAVFVALAVITLAAALRRPNRSTIDIALLFGALGIVVVESRVQSALALAGGWWTISVGALVMALPYLLLRLVGDFGRVSVPIRRAAEAGLVLSIIALIVGGVPTPPAITLALVAYFVVFATYAAVAFIPLARRSNGVTRRRMLAISIGSLLLAIALLVVAVPILVPQAASLASALVQVLALLAALAWFVGFAPPRALRRLWQEPELRAFLVRATGLARLPEERDVIVALQDGAGRTAGVAAAVGLWDEARGVMRWVRDGEEIERKPGEFFAWPAFQSGRVVFSADLSRERPVVAAAARDSRVEAAIAAPIRIQDRRIGALVLYSDRAPFFAEDDLGLAELLADQCAVVLENRRLAAEAAEARAKEETARLKEDFMSAAAHDLKTPLTTLVAQAQTMERHMRAGAQVDPAGVTRLAREAKRLQVLVEEMLEASRIEQGELQLQREVVDLSDLVHDVAARNPLGGRVRVEAPSGPARGLYDRARIERLIENLLENAAKYSPPDGAIDVLIQRDGAEVLISVRDHGIGIPADDRDRIFQRFERATNVDDRSYPGTGLGLYICRGIAEGHGGRIWVESELGAGSTFHVALPASEGALS
jgi:signal transduction histidine kinase